MRRSSDGLVQAAQSLSLSFAVQDAALGASLQVLGGGEVEQTQFQEQMLLIRPHSCSSPSRPCLQEPPNPNLLFTHEEAGARPRGDERRLI